MTHTQGNWQVSRSIYRDDKRPFEVYRHCPKYEVLLDKIGRTRRFATEAKALEAIKKATGGAA